MPPVPSALYLLLKNSSWRSSEDANSVAEGLRDGRWQYDPNESHDGVSMLRSVLSGWTGSNTAGNRPLLEITQALLDRGADADEVLIRLAQGAGHIHWEAIGDVHMLVRSRSKQHAPHADDALAIELMGALHGQGLKAVLDQHQGWRTRLHGVNMATWIALHTQCYGDNLPSWNARGGWAPAGAQATAWRMAKNYVNAAQQEKSLSDQDRIEAALALAGMIERLTPGPGASRTANEDAAVLVCRKTANGLLNDAQNHGLTLEAGLRALSENTDLSDAVRARLAAAAGGCIGSLATDATREQRWRIVAAALSLMRDARVALGPPAGGNLVMAQCGDPPPEFWDEVPGTPEYQGVLFDLLVGSYGNGGSNPSMRRNFMEGIAAWMERHPHLPAPDHLALIERAGAQIRREPEVMALLELVGLERNTAPAPSSTSGRGPRL